MNFDSSSSHSPFSTPAQLGGDPDWWKGGLIYQIYPRSYLDTNNDGVGDLGGIIQKLDYLAWLGVDAIWISPFFKSPMKDFGYDVSDYRDVDPLFGTLADFDALVAKAHQLGVRVLIDQVLSHTSDQHLWFKESRASKDNPKADWYVWADPQADGTPPTNWLSIFGGSAWEWDSRRRQYYLHNFLTSQPDLNFHHRDVQDALLEEMRFWLARGVDGFRLDTANMYFHDQQLRNNPPLLPGERVNGVETTNPYSMQNPKYNISRPENLDFLLRLRGLLDEYPATMTVGEVGAVIDMYTMVADYTEAGKRLHMAYSFDFMTPEFSAQHMRSVFERMQTGIGSGWPCWAFTNHDVPRVVSRWGLTPEHAPLLSAIMLCAQGTPCMYQGEELGLPEVDIPFEQLQDPYGIRFWPDYKGRDGCRTPMPWDADQAYAGFSAVTPWLPVGAEHLPRAVSRQQAEAGSVLHKTRDFIHWRRTQAALLKGDMHFLDAPENVVAFVRTQGDDKVLCVFNLGDSSVQFDSGIQYLQCLQGHGFGGTCAENGMIDIGAFDAFFGGGFNE